MASLAVLQAVGVGANAAPKDPLQTVGSQPAPNTAEGLALLWHGEGLAGVDESATVVPL